MSFKIWNDGDIGRDCHIEINGEDVSACVQTLAVHADASGPVTIALGLGVFETITPARPLRLWFANDTRDLLIKHGWTPPSESDAA